MTEPSNGIVRGLIAEIATGGHMASSTEGERELCKKAQNILAKSIISERRKR